MTISRRAFLLGSAAAGVAAAVPAFAAAFAATANLSPPAGMRGAVVFGEPVEGPCVVSEVNMWITGRGLVKLRPNLHMSEGQYMAVSLDALDEPVISVLERGPELTPIGRIGNWLGLVEDKSNIFTVVASHA